MDVIHDWLPLLISLFMFIIALVTLSRNGKKETEGSAMTQATMMADIRYIRQSIEDMKVENRKVRDDFKDLDGRVQDLTVVAKDLETRVKRLEDHQA